MHALIVMCQQHNTHTHTHTQPAIHRHTYIDTHTHTIKELPRDQPGWRIVLDNLITILLIERMKERQRERVCVGVCVLYVDECVCVLYVEVCVSVSKRLMERLIIVDKSDECVCVSVCMCV